MSDLEKILDTAPKNLSIVDSILKARSVLSRHSNVAVSVSGGADSDCVLDLLELVKPDSCAIRYVFWDTGLEFNATKRHLDYLEEKYGIVIERRRAEKMVAAACREYGVPFISKDASDMFYRLQNHNFDWNDSAEAATPEKYGKCKSALDWFFDRRGNTASGKSRFSIARFAMLREFVSAYPPLFKISEKCCEHAKKRPSRLYYKANDIDLAVTGMRRAEGGARSGVISSCFSLGKDGAPDNYRPVWYWTDADKALYKSWRELRYSDCYEIWGMTRTGCVGCPCNSNALIELDTVRQYEPQLVKAAFGIFGESYNYKAQYNEFKRQHKNTARATRTKEGIK